MQNPTRPRIGATILGYPRIGRDRELKKALEAFWAGRITGPDLDAAADAVRRDGLQTMRRAGLDTVPVNTFSWYDHVLDTAVLVGAVPERFAAVSGEHRLAGFDADRYFAMARGTSGVAPLEMTKWFDTNYHYLVPEVDAATPFTLHADKPLSEVAEADRLGLFPRPVLVGPYTFLVLAKAADTAPEGFVPLDRLDELVEVYAELLGTLSDAGVTWVQFDEPAAALDLDEATAEAVRRAYLRLGQAPARPAILVSAYFADPVEGLRALADTPVEALGLDLVRGPAPEEAASIPGIADKTLVLGVVDGRNIWRTDLRAALGRLQEWFTVGGDVAVSTSCSLLHVPYDVSVETELDPSLRAVLAFADQKIDEVVALQRALSEGASAVQEAIHASDRALEGRAGIPGLSVPEVAQRLDRVGAADRARASQAERDNAQADWLGLPVLPTTTIGSYPQTGDVRRTRAAFRRGDLDETAYRARMRDEIRTVVALQERLGLDVLVHGEPERNDMVQYFAELLDGYATTQQGWVQSYGSRCVRPPILFGDIHRPRPMTLEWIDYAQGLTRKPVKGMLTGPVTMLAWSFVREDQPRQVTADQVALALRDEVGDLEAAGIGIIQVDEPALRETLPLRAGEQRAYLDWAVAAFRLATSGVAPRTQVHTHLCYSEFGEIIGAIDGLDADVTSIEAARSRMEVLGDVAAHGFSGAVGPGVYDIHSPRVPDQGELGELLQEALRHVPAAKLWVNPDCGLKTRGYAEVEPALGNLVAAAQAARAALG